MADVVDSEIETSGCSEMGTEREHFFWILCVTATPAAYCPKPSELARKRKVDHNPPPKGKRKSLGRGTVGPKSVSPSQRIREHLGSA